MATEGKSIIVFAGVRIKDGEVENFAAEAAKVVTLTRAEKGCLRYDLLQDTFDKNSFWFYEEYADNAAYVAHRGMPYMSEFRPKRERMLDRYLGLRTFEETEAER